MVRLRLRRDRAGEPAPEAMRRRFAAIQVAVKNQDNREHDIFDSDDYLQDHGGMVAAVRALAGQGRGPGSATPSNRRAPGAGAVGGGGRVVRTGCSTPLDRGHAPPRLQGAFELAATVDYLFGYDATARVVEDWMYERVTESYVADPEIREFFRDSNPWACARSPNAC